MRPTANIEVARTLAAIVPDAWQSFERSCIDCNGPLGGIYYGAGDGTGSAFRCATCHERREMQTRYERILADVRYKDWTFKVQYDGGDHWYLQVQWKTTDTRDGTTVALCGGRKWLLSSHMVKSEIVQTALMAVLAAEEHETRELFTYKGEAIFGPHFNVEHLVALAKLGDAHETR